MVKYDQIKENWDKLKNKVVMDYFNIYPLEDICHLWKDFNGCKAIYLGNFAIFECKKTSNIQIS